MSEAELNPMKIAKLARRLREGQEQPRYKSAEASALTGSDNDTFRKWCARSLDEQLRKTTRTKRRG